MEYHLETRKVQGGGSVAVAEAGPLRASVRVACPVGRRSRVTQLIALDRDADQVDFFTEVRPAASCVGGSSCLARQVDWHENRKFLKVHTAVVVLARC